MSDLQIKIDAWFDKYKIGKQGFFYKNASKMCNEIIGESFHIVPRTTRCGCTDLKNFVTDGFKITCQIHHMSWNTLEYKYRKEN